MSRVAKKVADNPISKNLDKLIRSGNGSKANFAKIEAETGIPKSSVRSWINGHRKIQQANLEKIANVFGVDMYSLWEYTEDDKLSQEKKEIISLVEKIKDKIALEALRVFARAWVIREGSTDNKKESE